MRERCAREIAGGRGARVELARLSLAVGLTHAQPALAPAAAQPTAVVGAGVLRAVDAAPAHIARARAVQAVACGSGGQMLGSDAIKHLRQRDVDCVMVR